MEPLTGIRVLDVSMVVAGPFCSLLLADLGAEVIKVERPGQGDLARELRPLMRDDAGKTVSSRFVGLNRGKKSVCIDLESPGGQSLFKEIAGHCDVLIENQRPGRMKKWGLDYESLRAVNPRLVYASISGFGNQAFGSSPLMEKLAFDLVPLALSGFMDMNGEAERPPQRPGGIPLGDYLPAIFTALAVVAALRQRDKKGSGCFIDCSMYESVLAILERPVAMYIGEGVVETRNGGRVPQPYGVFQVKDGFITIGALGTVMWKRLCNAIGRPEWIDDSRFKIQEERYKHYYSLIEPEIIAWCRERTAVQVAEIMERHGVPAAKVRTIAEAVECPHIDQRKVLQEVPLTAGGSKKVRVLRPPFLMSGREERAMEPAPRLGEHTLEVLAGLIGYDAEKIALLLAEKVIGTDQDSCWIDRKGEGPDGN